MISERWQADEPVSAWREPFWVRMRRRARKHRVAVAVAAALLMATTIGLGVSTALIARERNEAEAQGEQARQAIQLLTGAADLAFDERLDPFQKEFLKRALEYYQRFTAGRGQSEGASGARPGLSADGRHSAQASTW